MSETTPTPPRHGVTGIAGDVVDALKASPTMLLMVVLNIAFLAAAAYYLSAQEANRAAISTELLKLIDRCATQTVPMEVYRKGQ